MRGSLWHIRYPIEGEPGEFITVATTRPETMLGDTAVAVHPEDERFAAPGRPAGDPAADRPRASRSSPTNTPTRRRAPARSRSPRRMTSTISRWASGTAWRCRPCWIPRRGWRSTRSTATCARSTASPTPISSAGSRARTASPRARPSWPKLEELGLLEKVEPHTHQVPHGDRGGVPIEPRLTLQWYCRRRRPWRSRRSRRSSRAARSFVPQQWENTFFAWMRDIQPWCISRQLWWGHRSRPGMAPDGTIFVEKTKPRRKAAARAHYGADVPLDAATTTCWTPGSAPRCGRSARSAGRSRPPELAKLLPGRRAGDRLRHHLLLGRPDDDDGPALHGRCAVPHGLHPWPGPRREGPEDVEVQGQRHRPAGADRRLRRGCAALHHLRADRAGPRREARPQAGRGLPQLRHQALERRALRRDERHRARSPASTRPRRRRRWRAGSSMRPTARWPRRRRRWKPIASTTMPPPATASSGTASATGSWNSPSRSSTVRTGRRRTRSRAPRSMCWASSCGCCTRPSPFVTEELWDRFGYGAECSLIRAAWPETSPVADAEAAREELDWVVRLISEVRAVRAEMNVAPSVTTPLLLKDAARTAWRGRNAGSTRSAGSAGPPKSRR